MSAIATVTHRQANLKAVDQEDTRPIIAGVDSSPASRAAIHEAVRLASDLGAPLVFAYVRRGPAGFLGTPVYQRRLTEENARADRVLERALAVANSVGVSAESEVLEGSPKRRISELARDRNARLIVVGQRRHKLGQSVSAGVIDTAVHPVVVARSQSRRTEAT